MILSQSALINELALIEWVVFKKKLRPSKL